MDGQITPDLLAQLLQPLLALGLPGVLIVWLGWQKWQADKRNDALVQQLVELATKTATELAGLSTSMASLRELVSSLQRVSA